MERSRIHINNNLDKIGVYDLFLYCALGCIQVCIYIALYYYGDLSDNINIFVSYYILLFIGYILIIFLYKDNQLLQKLPRSFPFAVFLFAIAFRIIMINTDIYLSTDILRYQWDGMLLSNGLDPYKYVPSSEELERFQNVEYYKIYDHKNEYTIYPPFAQLFFVSNYLLFGNTIVGIKSLLSIIDIANGLLILLIIKRLYNNRFHAYQGALIYLWNPLVIIEFSNSGHIDALAIFLFLLFLLFLTQSSTIKSSFFLVLSAFTKWIPLLAIPLFCKYILVTDRSKLVKIVSSMIIFSIIISLPFYISSGLNLFLTTINFFQNWRFESAASRFLIFVFQIKPLEELFLVKIISYLTFIICYFIFLLYISSYKSKDVLNQSLFVFALFYLFTPAVYPWYTIWMISISTLSKDNMKIWLSILLTGISVVNYLHEFYLLTEMLFWILYILWFIPIISLLVLSLWRMRDNSQLLKKLRLRLY